MYTASVRKVDFSRFTDGTVLIFEASLSMPDYL